MIEFSRNSSKNLKIRQYFWLSNMYLSLVFEQKIKKRKKIIFLYIITIFDTNDLLFIRRNHIESKCVFEKNERFTKKHLQSANEYEFIMSRGKNSNRTLNTHKNEKLLIDSTCTNIGLFNWNRNCSQSETRHLNGCCVQPVRFSGLCFTYLRFN